MRKISISSKIDLQIFPRVYAQWGYSDPIAFHAGESISVELSVIDLDYTEGNSAEISFKRWDGNAIPSTDMPSFLYKKVDQSEDGKFVFEYNDGETELPFAGNFWIAIQVSTADGKVTVVNQNAFIKNDSLNPDVPIYPTIAQIEEWMNQMNELLNQTKSAAQSASRSAGTATQAKEDSITAKNESQSAATESANSAALAEAAAIRAEEAAESMKSLDLQAISENGNETTTTLIASGGTQSGELLGWDSVFVKGSVVVGSGANIGELDSDTQVAIGKGASAIGTNSIVIGQGTAKSDSCVVIGNSTTPTNLNSIIAIGLNITFNAATPPASMAIGYNSNITTSDIISGNQNRILSIGRSGSLPAYKTRIVHVGDGVNNDDAVTFFQIGSVNHLPILDSDYQSQKAAGTLPNNTIFYRY